MFKEYCIKNEIRPIASDLAIDLGEGNGIQSIALSELGFEINAIDFNDKLISEFKIKIKLLIYYMKK